nr:CPBP family glutamic-type intramembrane protease [Polyangium spumosum]
MGVLYGGITEELLMRWGLATFLAWILYKIGGKPEEPPAAWMLATAVALAAVLFGAGHLPAVIAQGIPLSPPVVARILVLNALAGLAFGWLYVRRSLEAAMLSHAAVHVLWSAVALVA